MAQAVEGMDADAKPTRTYLRRVWANYPRMAVGSKAQIPQVIEKLQQH
ncbi:MAG: hypothetical protein P8Y45_18580 [Exilibacterium sp.]